MISTLLAIALAQAPLIERDKAEHFGGALALTLGVYGFESLIQAPRSVKVWNAALATTTACALREVWGNRDSADFVWCTAGIAVGLPLALLIDHLVGQLPKQTEDCIRINGALVCVE